MTETEYEKLVFALVSKVDWVILSFGTNALNMTSFFKILMPEGEVVTFIVDYENSYKSFYEKVLIKHYPEVVL